MDRRDVELLDKQLRAIYPTRRNHGVLILAIVAVFFAGITLGASLFGYKSEPTRIASNDMAAALPFLSSKPPTVR